MPGFDPAQAPAQRPRFEGATFIASMQEMKFTAQGDLRFIFNVPYSDRHEALPLMDAHGLSLRVVLTRKERR